MAVAAKTGEKSLKPHCFRSIATQPSRVECRTICSSHHVLAVKRRMSCRSSWASSYEKCSISCFNLCGTARLPVSSPSFLVSSLASRVPTSCTSKSIPGTKRLPGYHHHHRQHVPAHWLPGPDLHCRHLTVNSIQATAIPNQVYETRPI